MDNNYKAYLNSWQWQEKREEYLQEYGSDACEMCGTVCENLQVHHKHYRNIYDEDMNDLIALCPECHSQMHDEI